MKIKIMLSLAGIILIVGLAIFGSGIKEKVSQGIVDDIPEYNCGQKDICTSCIINGNACSCGTSTCACGNNTVDISQCQLI
jgi:hypothetical protein